MLRKDGEIFLQHPDETSRRILHRGTITEIGEEKSYIAQFEEQDLGIEADLEFLLYYELRQKFVKQGARIVEVIVAEDGTEEDATAVQEQPVRFVTTSDPAPAESRECYRVSTAVANIIIEVAKEDCKLLDVSITGFAVVSTQDHKIGSTLVTTLTHEDQRFTGNACVQSVRELPDGSFRFGLLCSDQNARESELKKGLQKMSMFLQREQLRRMSGAA